MSYELQCVKCSEKFKSIKKLTTHVTVNHFVYFPFRCCTCHVYKHSQDSLDVKHVRKMHAAELLAKEDSNKGIPCVYNIREDVEERIRYDLEASLKKIPDWLVCFVCGELLKEAVVVVCCGWSCCEECIENRENGECPNCNKGVDSFVANINMRSEVESYEKDVKNFKERGLGLNDVKIVFLPVEEGKDGRLKTSGKGAWRKTETKHQRSASVPPSRAGANAKLSLERSDSTSTQLDPKQLDPKQLDPKQSDWICSTLAELLHFLSQSFIHMADKDAVKIKLHIMIKGGRKLIYVVSDFDGTLSKLFVKKGFVCHAVNQVFESEAGKRNKLAAKLLAEAEEGLAAEKSTEMAQEQKIKVIEKWYFNMQERTKSLQLSKESLVSLVRESKVYLRNGADELFKLAQECEIPLAIFSASVTDFLRIFLEQQLDSFPANVEIVSNQLEWCPESGLAVGFVPPMIHSMNKTSEVVDKSSAFMSEVRGRPNMLLLGDSTGDTDMQLGVEQEQSNILRLGFLNNYTPEQLKTHMQHFDIVL